MLEKLKNRTKSLVYDVCNFLGKKDELLVDYREEFLNSYLSFGRDSFNFLVSLFPEASGKINKENDLIASPSNGLISVTIIDDYTKLRMGKTNVMLMKTLVEKPEDRVGVLQNEISLFIRKWKEIVGNLEEYYISFSTLDYTSQRILSILSTSSGTEEIRKLNKKYGVKYCYDY